MRTHGSEKALCWDFALGFIHQMLASEGRTLVHESGQPANISWPDYSRWSLEEFENLVDRLTELERLSPALPFPT